MRKYFYIISIALNVFLVLVLIFTRAVAKSGQQPVYDIALYPFLSKRIFAESQNDILINFIPLRNALQEYIGKQPEEIGVYFEYLPSGNSIGINDRMEVRFASLIKIPVVMSVYKQIELGKLHLNDNFTIKKEHISKLFGDIWKRGEGALISIREAIEASLIASDNTATRVLAETLPQGAIDDVFDSLDIPKDKTEGVHVISPKNYSSILRSLYLSSFLSRENSNEILSLLTRTNFNDKLPAGAAPDVKVAHKIGVFDLEEADRIFSDCGIVYAEKRPYILCIMVNASEEKSREHMVYLSKMIYGYLLKVAH